MIAVVAGIIGYLVVLRRAAFATHALGHTGFSGAAGAVLFGVNPVYGLLLFTMSTGTGIALLGPRAANRDVEIGTVLAFALGVGLLFISLYTGYDTEVYSILFGEVLGISLQPSRSHSRTVGRHPDRGGADLSAPPVRLVGRGRGRGQGPPDAGIGTLLHVVARGYDLHRGPDHRGAAHFCPDGDASGHRGTSAPRRPAYAVLVAILVAVFATWAGLIIAFYEAPPASFFIVTIAFLLYVAVRAAPPAAGLLRRISPSVRRQKAAPSGPPSGSDAVGILASQPAQRPLEPGLWVGSGQRCSSGEVLPQPKESRRRDLARSHGGSCRGYLHGGKSCGEVGQSLRTMGVFHFPDLLPARVHAADAFGHVGELRRRVDSARNGEPYEFQGLAVPFLGAEHQRTDLHRANGPLSVDLDDQGLSGELLEREVREEPSARRGRRHVRRRV